jgi:hypothetical protein
MSRRTINLFFVLVLLLSTTLFVAPAFASPEPPGAARGGATSPYVAPAADPDDVTEGFDDVTLLWGADWYAINHSEPLGLLDPWYQGADTVFTAQAGCDTCYIAANYNATAGTGTISGWLLLPTQTLKDGDVFSFWTRTATGSAYPDRLQVRMSTNGTSTNVGTTSTDVGDFTTLLADVNPTLAVGGYPEVWTQYVITLTGITTATPGRLAFRYFVTGGGPSGANSNYIGVDTVTFTQTAPLSVDLVALDAKAAAPVAGLPILGAVALSVVVLGAAVYLRRR